VYAENNISHFHDDRIAALQLRSFKASHPSSRAASQPNSQAATQQPSSSLAALQFRSLAA
jgi:hypothetical protein